MLVNLKDECFSSIKLPSTGWSKSYVGIPFQDGGREGEALDCWGLLRTVYQHELGIDLPSYSDSMYDTSTGLTRGADILAAQLDDHRRSSDWVEVPKGSEQLLDAVLLRIMGASIHVALVIDPARSTMLHTEKGVGSITQRYTSPQWVRRVTGFFRHRLLEGTSHG